MRLVRNWLLLALVPWLAGLSCPAIYSEQPLGEIAVLDPQKLDGTWMGPNGAIEGVRVLDAQKGTIALWSVREEPDRPMTCEPPQEALRTCSESPLKCTWRSAPSKGAAQKEGTPSIYWITQPPKGEVYRTEFFLLSDGRSAAVVYGLASQKRLDERLKELIANGTIPGRVTAEGKPVVGTLLPEHFESVFKAEAGVVEWTKPLPLLKLPDSLDPCKKPEPGK